MPANLSLIFNTSSAESSTSPVDARFSSQDSISLAMALASGAADNQCNLICEARSAAATVPDEIDLSLVSDQNGALAAFAKLKALIVCNKGTENPLAVGGTFFGSAAAIAIPPGGALALLLPHGIDITANSNDTITIGSAVGTDYELRLVGVAVAEEE